MSAGSRSKLNIKIIKKSDNQNFVYRVKAWFDNARIDIKDQSDSIAIESPALISGQHIWKIKTYIIDKKQERTLQSAIAKYELDLPNSQKKLDDLKSELDSIYKEISNPVDIIFEVL